MLRIHWLWPVHLFFTFLRKTLTQPSLSPMKSRLASAVSATALIDACGICTDQSRAAAQTKSAEPPARHSYSAHSTAPLELKVRMQEPRD